MNYGKRIVYWGTSFFVISLLLTATSWAQQTAKFYIGGSAGPSWSPNVTVIGDSNDRSSICDEFINPLYALLPECTVPNRGEGDNWSVPFDATWGAFGSAFVGYRLSSLVRAELELLVRISNYGERSPVVSAAGVNLDKLNNELFIAEEWLGTVSTLGLMANVHFDLNMIDGPILPYLGVGIGFANTKVDYGSVWSRSPNPDDIRTGRDQPNAEEIAQNLAGVASSGHVTMENTLLAFQAIAGAEYFVHERVAFDFRARLLLSQEFSGTIVWDPLRSHVPNLRRDGSEPVDGIMSSDEFSAVVLSFGMKYFF
ncbi:MAG: outer membrane beta-barrel protein [Rhodothermaceae bacterium]|nr:outer membrane beta-barrel protein [Rhodothermaceae bacterium]MYC03540.1 outer membrane beta-barrel protein [Rhodothermaceae bacterium]MYI17789.1 outer membrane beta-barrel protein [Rhodothermaceae bacterium]